MSVPPQPGLEAVVNTPNTNPPNGAQSPIPSPAAFAHGANGERTFTADDLARVRQEEKDKLYGEIAGLKTQWAEAQKTLESIQSQKDAELAEQQRKDQEKADLARLKKEEEMSAKSLLEQKLRETNETWEQRFNQLQEERLQERAFADKERQFNELLSYRTDRLNEFADDIAPQFHGFIQGDSKEQIDLAIEQAKAATQSIFEQVQASQQQVAQQPRGVSPTGYSAFGPLDNGLGQKTSYSAKDINEMSMAEYSEFRVKAGLASADAARNRGLFG